MIHLSFFWVDVIREHHTPPLPFERQSNEAYPSEKLGSAETRSRWFWMDLVSVFVEPFDRDQIACLHAVNLKELSHPRAPSEEAPGSARLGVARNISEDWVWKSLNIEMKEFSHPIA
jgi:hypothetical protein